MTSMMKVAVLGMTVAFCAIFSTVRAQDDIDSLLKDLDEEAAGEAKAEAKAEEPKPAEPAAAVKAEEPAAEAPAVAEKAEEPKAEEPAAEAKAEEPKAEEPAAEAPAEEAKAEEPAAEAPAAEKAEEPAAEAPAEEAKTEEPAAEEPAADSTDSNTQTTQTLKPSTVSAVSSDAELIDNVRTSERLRRTALDTQATREIVEARASMERGEYGDAVQHYGLALKLLNDRASSKGLRKECDQGIAEGLYRQALQEEGLGRRAEAKELMEKALDRRHPKARRVLERWHAEEGRVEEQADASDIKHRMNEKDYKESREQIRKHLKRSRQYLAVRDMEHALEECEIVLVNDPYNHDAIRIRNAIEKKRKVTLEQEREAAREGMIADVDEKWRPVYAVNAARLNETTAETVKKQTGDDPERTVEQGIEERMKKMRLPTISFKPPATIIDAVDFFRGASVDFDDPNLPREKRGFNFVLRTPQGAIKQQTQAAEEGSDDFSSDGGEEESASQSNGLPPIPTITASDITFYEALKLVCDSVDYKFIVRGPIVMVMHKDMSTAELLSRKYDVLDAFLERMTSASADVKEMKASGFGSSSKKSNDDAEENQEKDWKGFFEQMGVKWPEGSSIMYIKTLGKLYVRNTRENLAEFEKVLQEMGSQPKLIEIETRFVEVSQEDLNSLGFEWILNSDYSIDVGNKLGKALGIGQSYFDGSESVVKTVTGYNTSTATSGGTTTQTLTPIYKTTVIENPTVGAGLIKGAGSIPGKDYRTIGINAFGGTSEQQNGNRYLSTVGNHISGEAESTNDQFMKVNAFLGDADLSMILHMLSQRSDTDLLSAPKVVTKSGENAVIKVVTEMIYPQDYDVQIQSSSSGSSGSSSGSQSAILAIVEPQNFTMREVGVILDVTPTYSEANGGTIDLELKPSVVELEEWHNYGMQIPFTGNASSGNVVDIGSIFEGMSTALTTIGATLTDSDKEVLSKGVVASAMTAVNNVSTSGSQNMTWYDAPMQQPFFHTRSIDSKVSITPGSTVVMGGLITEERKAMDDKIPFLGDLPYVGRLFRSHAEQTKKRNLLVFVTGRLITPAGRELSLNEETAAAEDEVKAAPKAE